MVLVIYMEFDNAYWVKHYERDAFSERIQSIGFAAIAGLGVVVAAEGNLFGLAMMAVGGGLAYLTGKEAEDSAVEAAKARGLLEAGHENSEG